MNEYDVTPPPERLAERVRIRTAFSTDGGEVTRFVVQLEYGLEGNWHEVVRYDHDREVPGSHDVTDEGLHRDGEKYRTEAVTPPILAGKAFDHAEDDLRNNAQRFVKRFERWPEVTDGTNL